MAMSDEQSIMQQQLAQGVVELGCAISLEQQHQMIAYLILLDKWNRTHNLTAIRESQKMVTHHLLDSLSIIPYLKGDAILDVGTGGGVPGIPLAIACPEKSFVLVDSHGKKTRFLKHAVQTLGLLNVEVHHSRVEQLSQTHTFDVIMARAVSTLKNLLQWTQSLLKEDGRWVLMKGAYPEEELQSVVLPCQTIPIEVPGLDAQRHIVMIKLAG